MELLSCFFALIFLAAFSSANPAQEHNIRSSLHRKRALDGYFYVDRVEGDEIGCSNKQLATVHQAVVEAKTLAQRASDALSWSSSENSEPYRKWFGSGNANTVTRTAIKQNNYDPIANVRPPWEQNRIHDANMATLSPTGLTFVCIPPDYSLCKPGTAAITFQIGAISDNTGTFIALCPPFFGRPSWQEMLDDWRISGWEDNEVQLSSGFTLLHEFQHVHQIVGRQRRCTDVENYAPASNDASHICYHPYCCEHINDSDKIQNAQNIAYFALDVTVNRI